MILQMAYFDRTRDPVTTDLGPVLTLEDVIGGKICALAGRAYERDYLDTAAALELYSPAELISLARQLDPGLDGRDFAEAGQRLDQIPDSAFTIFGLTRHDVATLRERFAAWPRDPQAADPGTADQPGTTQPGHRNATLDPGRVSAAAPAMQPCNSPRQADREQPCAGHEPEIEP